MQLHLATTLETFSWSLTGAVGAAIGGALASRLGNSTCFLIDAVTYIIAAWCASKIPRALGDPAAMEKAALLLKKNRSRLSPEALAALEDGDGEALAIEMAPLAMQKRGSSGLSGSLEGGEDDDQPGHVTHAERRHMPVEQHAKTVSHGGNSRATNGINSSNGSGTSNHALGERSLLLSTSTAAGPRSAADSDGLLLPRGSGGTGTSTGIATGRSLISDAWAAVIDGVAAAVEGWRYLTSLDNRDVAAIVLMKGCGSITWGAVDVLNVRQVQRIKQSA